MWKENLQMFISLPEGLSAAPVHGKYTSVEKTCGPDRYTPIKKSLAFKRVSGLYTILSGGMIWAAARVEPKTDTKLVTDLAIALFCLQQHPLYCTAPESRASLAVIDAADRFTGPILFILDKWYDHRIRSHDRWPVLPPHNMVGDLLTLTRFLIGAEHKDDYDAWVAKIITRLDTLVPFPGHNKIPADRNISNWDELSAVSMGPALPPHVLDRAHDPDPALFESQCLEFLETVEIEDNAFLNSPQRMVELGFKGEPYRVIR